MLLDPREPISAWSHGLGMVAALPLTWLFLRRWRDRWNGILASDEETREIENLAAAVCAAADAADTRTQTAAYELGKAVSLLVFGLSLAFCYGGSALYHAVPLSGEPLNWFRKLDHVGIYLLIAGTYTPGAWALMRRPWRNATLLSVWVFAAGCALRVWVGGILPPWSSTIIYLGMGWGVVVCYREVARTVPHRELRLLPLGGLFYSIGAIINVAGSPALLPGQFGAHELFHVFVLAGSACHVVFMDRVVLPARRPEDAPPVSISASVSAAPPRTPLLRPHRLFMHCARCFQGQACAQNPE